MYNMYMLYDEWFDTEKYSNRANKRQYMDILNVNFNIRFHKPKKKKRLKKKKTTYLKHQASKKAARHLKQLDKDEAKSNDDVPESVSYQEEALHYFVSIIGTVM